MLLIVACGLAACQPRPGGHAADAGAGRAGEAAYLSPPSPTSAGRLAGGRIAVDGRADPNAQVRLATPAGVATLGQADDAGRWRLTLPASADLRLMGLSMSRGPRVVQSEGYLAIMPDGHAAQLRSGAGALVLSPGPGLRLTAVDFDKQGGAVISGVATPGATVNITLDGIPRQAGVDADGRFSLVLNEPLGAGGHTLEASEGAVRVRASAPVSPPAALTGAPFRAERTAFGWRIDWMTPGGGVQTTLILETSEPAT